MQTVYFAFYCCEIQMNSNWVWGEICPLQCLLSTRRLELGAGWDTRAPPPIMDKKVPPCLTQPFLCAGKSWWGSPQAPAVRERRGGLRHVGVPCVRMASEPEGEWVTARSLVWPRTPGRRSCPGHTEPVLLQPVVIWNMLVFLDKPVLFWKWH